MNICAEAGRARYGIFFSGISLLLPSFDDPSILLRTPEAQKLRVAFGIAVLLCMGRADARIPDNINRNSVAAADGDGRSKVKKNATPTLALGTDSKWSYGSTEVTTAPVLCGTLA